MARYEVQIDYRSRNGSNTYISFQEEANSESEAKEKACSKIKGEIIKIKIYKK